MRNFVREKRICCGKNYMEVDLYCLNENQLEKKKGKRSKKKKVSLPKQEKMNDKNSRRRLIQIGETNFSQGDIFLTLTYKDKYLPKNYDDAMKEITNYFLRIKRRMKKNGIDEELKYILVTSQKEKSVGDDKEIRFHHHILIRCGLDRDILEDLWRRRKKKGESIGDPIGYANSKRIQEDINTGILGLLNYLARHSTHKRKWTCSQNLERPIERSNDHKYSHKKLLELALNPYVIEKWERIYKGYTVADKDNGVEAAYNEFTGWSIYLKLRKKERLKC